jgi:DNA topoisomerase IB
MWVIDILALRVGGEKGEDEADTVGCCSLRREHLTFGDNKESYEIDLEFLGKVRGVLMSYIKYSEMRESTWLIAALCDRL